ncbi:MAG: Nre family DNA repair protein [Candidatus Micrarchaeia archaeon]
METLERLKMIRELETSTPGVKRSEIVYKHMKDPALLRYYYKMKTLSSIGSTEVLGSSPTDLFVGRYNYPKVFIGPLLPPEFGDTSLLSTPERWRYMDIEKIVEMRSKLVRGMHISNVYDVEKGRLEEQVRDLAIAERPAEAEVKFESKPFVKIALNDEVEPFGPSAVMKDFELYNVKSDKKIESRYYDDAATATTSLKELYERGVPVSKLQRAFSAGVFGLKNARKFVPTRWSITAVDDTLSKANLSEVKYQEPIDAIRVFYNSALDNRWLIFFFPGYWQYESIEAWYPKTIWNDGNQISMYSSYEGYRGRKTYAEIGGCYYAARLAVTEKLQEMNKQAMVLILRETHEGYVMPVGVWNVREHVRQTLNAQPTVLEDLSQVFEYVRQKLAIPPKEWIRNSTILKSLLMQRRLF